MNWSKANRLEKRRDDMRLAFRLHWQIAFQTHRPTDVASFHAMMDEQTAAFEATADKWAAKHKVTWYEVMEVFAATRHEALTIFTLTNFPDGTKHP